jgi:hypothetical protein
MTQPRTGTRSAEDGRVLVGVKAQPSGWPTASLDPDSKRGPKARSGSRHRVYEPQKLVFTVSGDCQPGPSTSDTTTAT